MNSIAERWNRFFFEPQSPVPLALFRIFYGTLVVLTLLLLRPDWLAWYGTRAWISLSTIQQIEPGPRLNLFTLLPQNDPTSDIWIQAFFWVFLVSAVLLAAGFLTRLTSIIVFLGLASIQQRNFLLAHGGDVFLRVTGFFLMFAPAGAALSIDRLIRMRRGKEGEVVQPQSPWAQRMIQFELAMVYFAAFWWKIEGAPWREGTALSYVYRLEELHRFPLPSWFLNPTLLQAGTWFALALEFSLGTLIWIKRFRYPLLALGVVFHLMIEYSLNVPLFEWDVLAAYVLFVDAVDIQSVFRRLQLVGRGLSRVSSRRVSRRIPPSTT